jgi:hypothetical protein
VQDGMFLAVAILFFGVSLGYVVFCERDVEANMGSGPSIMPAICCMW